MKHLLSRLKKIFDNKKNENRPITVLGDVPSVREFALFWEKNASGLQLLSAELMFKAVSSTMSKKEFEAYKKAIGDFGIFFAECCLVFEKTNAIEKQINESKEF